MSESRKHPVTKENNGLINCYGNLYKLTKTRAAMNHEASRLTLWS